MPDKVAGGSWHEGTPGEPTPVDPAPEARAEEDRLQAKRDSARWTAVTGFLMMFLAGLHIGFATGGVLMVLFGAGGSLYWGRRLRRLKGDPWAYDPDLDGPASLEWRQP